MDIRQLRQFVAVAQTLHFSLAAQRLCMTQPPLSQSIMALEREIGAPLFTRTKRSVALTPLGAQWLPKVLAALEGIDALGPAAQAILNGDAGTLALSFVSTADYSILPLLVQRFRSLYPQVELSLMEATSDVQLAALLEGKGHVGIVIADPGASVPEPLVYRPLVSESLVAAVPQAWIDDGRLSDIEGRLPASAMITYPLVVFPRRAAPAFHDLVTGYYTACGGSLQVAQHAIQMQTIISLVSAGMGIALVPASLRHMARSGVRYLDLDGNAPQLETGLVYRREDRTATLANFLAIALTPSSPRQTNTPPPSTTTVCPVE